MQTTTTVGLDIAKSVFQVHSIDADGKVVCVPSAQAALCFGVFQKLPLAARRRHPQISRLRHLPSGNGAPAASRLAARVFNYLPKQPPSTCAGSALVVTSGLAAQLVSPAGLRGMQGGSLCFA